MQEHEVVALFQERIDTEDAAFLDGDGAVRARRIRRLGRIILSEAPLERPSGTQIARVLEERLSADPSLLQDWLQRPETAQLCARVAMMRRLDGELWPDLGALVQDTSILEWLLPHVADARGLSDLTDQAVAAALERVLDHTLRYRLRTMAPERFETPAGGSAAIDYAVDNGPAIEVRLQELFGLDTHPAVGDGRTPLLVKLLSPARRPIQTTRDLPGFWRGTYAAVRSDMRGRYPKHPWPDDPIAATPTRHAKPRRA
jgi:ATP-dependent helicase HrpB